MSKGGSKIIGVKVSVCVVSYNQRRYLEECLDSLVNQETSFPYEIIVGDDASTDGTSEIITEYAKRYADLVIPVLHEKNMGPTQNYFSVHRLARGAYVCHLDGDDVALPGKLEGQAAFLDAHPDVSVLWHRMRFFDDGGVEKEHPSASAFYVNQPISKKDLVLFGSMGTHSSIMYRKENFSARYEHRDTLDWLISVELVGSSVAYVMPEVLGKYRVHSAGISGGARANRKIRKVFCECQVALLRRYPEYAEIIALRALFLAALDFLKIRPYFITSLLVFLRCKSIPALSMSRRLICFYKLSRLPKEFT